MDQPVIFARHFSQLVWLLMREPANIDEQKAALRAMVAVSKGSQVSLALHGEALRANSSNVPLTLTGATDVAGQMGLHGLALITFDAGVPPAQLLGVARLLAGMPILGDGGAAAEAKRLALGATNIRFAGRPVIQPQIPEPSRPSGSFPTLALPDMELGDVLEDPLAEAKAKVAPRVTSSFSAMTPSSGSRAQEGGMFAQFAASRSPTETHAQLLPQLDVAVDPGVISQLLDDLTVLAMRATKEGRTGEVSEIIHRIVRREPQLEDFDSKRIIAMALRKLFKPEPLKAVAAQVAREPDHRDQHVAILARAGQEGAEALIEHVVSMTNQRDRHLYYAVLRQLNTGAAVLMHMLSDDRWYVVRNAAEMLGELQVKDAEKALTDLLKHADERVRRAATGALMRMGTVRAMHAIQAGLSDAAPDMRMDAAAAIVLRRDPRTSATLLQALEAEKDESVQAAFLLSLGKLGTPDAVQRLIRGAEAERTLFKKKTTGFRVAAVHGLSEARTLEAMDALRALQNDRDPEVRDAAKFALGRIARMNGPADG
jgi:HEAT repeat protein